MTRFNRPNCVGTPMFPTDRYKVTRYKDGFILLRYTLPRRDSKFWNPLRYKVQEINHFGGADYPAWPAKPRNKKRLRQSVDWLRREPPEILRARHVPLSERRGAARRASRGLHGDGHHRAVKQAEDIEAKIKYAVENGKRRIEYPDAIKEPVVNALRNKSYNCVTNQERGASGWVISW